MGFMKPMRIGHLVMVMYTVYIVVTLKEGWKHSKNKKKLENQEIEILEFVSSRNDPIYSVYKSVPIPGQEDVLNWT